MWLLLLFAATAALSAQSTEGTLSGLITDTHAAAMTGPSSSIGNAADFLVELDNENSANSKG